MVPGVKAAVLVEGEYKDGTGANPVSNRAIAVKDEYCLPASIRRRRMP
jgi:hypothetical protein